MKENLAEVVETFNLSKWQSTDPCWILKDLEATIALGKSLTEIIPHLKILLLEGPLGAGKTSLVKGIAIGLGINEPITSPTFPLAQHYLAGKTPLFHLDLYRLENQNAADELFLQEEEEAAFFNALIVVEWPERLTLSLPEARKLVLKHQSNRSRFAYLLPPINSERNSFTSS